MKIKESTIISFLRIFIIVYACFFITGCALVNHLLGKTPEIVTKEIDTDGDGKLSKKEIKLSKYDLNKDGILSIEEMTAAMAPHESSDLILGLLSAFNVPLAGLATMALKSSRKNKGHVHSLVGGIDDLIEKKQDGYTKAELYESIQNFAKKKDDFVALGKVVGTLKKEIRSLKKAKKIQ